MLDDTTFPLLVDSRLHVDALRHPSCHVGERLHFFHTMTDGGGGLQGGLR